MKALESQPQGQAQGGSAGLAPGMEGAVVAALDADPGLNRGQKETIRMMYDKFTSKVGKR